MSNEITMPKLSDTMEEGKILRWLKHPGDKIARGEAIAEVETDKADMVLESFDEGVLDQIKLNEGESAPVGAVIATMKSAGEKDFKSDAKAAAAAAGKDLGVEAAATSQPQKPSAIKPKAAEKRVTQEIDRAGRRRCRRFRRRFARASGDVRESLRRADCYCRSSSAPRAAGSRGGRRRDRRPQAARVSAGTPRRRGGRRRYRACPRHRARGPRDQARHRQLRARAAALQISPAGVAARGRARLARRTLRDAQDHRQADGLVEARDPALLRHR